MWVHVPQDSVTFLPSWLTRSFSEHTHTHTLKSQHGRPLSTVTAAANAHVLLGTKSNCGRDGSDGIITHRDSIKQERDRGTVCAQTQSGELICGKNDASDTVTEWWAEGQIKVHKQIFSREDTDKMETVLAAASRTDHRHWVKLYYIYTEPRLR